MRGCGSSYLLAGAPANTGAVGSSAIALSLAAPSLVTVAVVAVVPVVPDIGRTLVQ
jgi:hypothetical protein